MKYKLTLIFLFLFQLAQSQPVNTNLSNGVLFDGEPYLAMNTINTQNLVAAWMGIKFSNGQYRIAIKTRASFDGGSTWSTVNSLPHFGNGFGSADVSMTFDKNGVLYISYIDYKQLPDSGGIYVARSIDGGLHWDTPNKAFDMYDVANKRPIDRPWLVVDKSNTSNSGTLYITTKPAPWIAPPNRNYFKSSSDSGHTWTSISNVDRGTHLVGNVIAAPMASPATDINGNFCAIYPSYVASQNPLPAFYLAKSTNKGISFNYSTVYAAVLTASDTNLKNGYLLLTNPIDSNKLIFFLPNAQNNDPDISALNSSNGGLTWSSLIRVNDDAVGNSKAQDMVWGAYNEQGKIAVTWRDRRLSTANGFWNAGYDFYYATSTNNGASFSPNQILSSQFIVFDSILAHSGNDFMCCTYHADTLYTIWGDTRSGKMNIYFAKTIASTNTSIEILQLNNETNLLTIFPNPAQDEISINISKDLLGKEITVFTSNGQKVFSTKMKSEQQKISTNNLPLGIYFLKIENQIKRFIKN